jgi:hypothetical protein
MGFRLQKIPMQGLQRVFSSLEAFLLVLIPLPRVEERDVASNRFPMRGAWGWTLVVSDLPGRS